MRIEETTLLGDQLQAAYLKSGMSPIDFAWYCYGEKEAVSGCKTEGNTIELTVVGDAIYTYYFSQDRWFCKV